MSKQRARRRAEREAGAARRAAVAAQARSKHARRRERRRRLTGLLPRPVRYARQGGIRARRRRSQNAAVLVIFLLVQTAAWLLLPTWSGRFAVLVVSVLVVPVAVTLAFDRRS